MITRRIRTAGTSRFREGPEAGSPDVVVARPVKTALIADITAAVVFAAFVVIAIVMPTDSAGATFGWKDQVFTVVIGAIVAGGLHLPARPRLRADRDGVRTRGFLGNWRTVPWEAIVRVEFPTNVRFARVVLAGDETLALYAVQRADGERAVATMRGLRRLFAATHPVA